MNKGSISVVLKVQVYSGKIQKLRIIPNVFNIVFIAFLDSMDTQDYCHQISK